jgi:L-amino acid N-acyltransferase YncA
MTEFTIRKAVSADAAGMARIYNHAVRHTTATFDLAPQSAADRRAWLASEGLRLALVADTGEHLAGWASLVQWSERCAYAWTSEASVYIAPEAQRTGVGAALGRALLEAAPGLGVHVLIAQICSENAGGIALAERLGFTAAGVLREVGFKFGRVLDVVILQRTV